MGTTGTITGISNYLKRAEREYRDRRRAADRWLQHCWYPQMAWAYPPGDIQKARVDRVEEVSQADAEEMARRMAVEEGIFAASAPLARRAGDHAATGEGREKRRNLVFIVRLSDRYLSTGVFPG